MSSWILIIFIFSGDHQGIKEITFGTQQQCEKAKEFTLGGDNFNKWRVNREMVRAECFKRN